MARVGERSNDELEMLEIESKLRRRSTEDRPRLTVPNPAGDAVRLTVDEKLVLSERKFPEYSHNEEVN